MAAYTNERDKERLTIGADDLGAAGAAKNVDTAGTLQSSLGLLDALL